jgi:hypothetical protein
VKPLVALPAPQWRLDAVPAQPPPPTLDAPATVADGGSGLTRYSPPEASVALSPATPQRRQLASSDALMFATLDADTFASADTAPTPADKHDHDGDSDSESSSRESSYIWPGMETMLWRPFHNEREFIKRLYVPPRADGLPTGSTATVSLGEPSLPTDNGGSHWHETIAVPRPRRRCCRIRGTRRRQRRRSRVEHHHVSLTSSHPSMADMAASMDSRYAQLDVVFVVVMREASHGCVLVCSALLVFSVLTHSMLDGATIVTEGQSVVMTPAIAAAVEAAFADDEVELSWLASTAAWRRAYDLWPSNHVSLSALCAHAVLAYCGIALNLAACIVLHNDGNGHVGWYVAVARAACHC